MQEGFEEKIEWFGASYASTTLADISFIFFGTALWKLSQEPNQPTDYSGLWFLPGSLLSLTTATAASYFLFRQELELSSPASIVDCICDSLFIAQGYHYYRKQKRKFRINHPDYANYSWGQRHLVWESWMVVQSILSLISDSLYVTGLLADLSDEKRIDIFWAATAIGFFSLVTGFVVGETCKKNFSYTYEEGGEENITSEVTADWV